MILLSLCNSSHVLTLFLFIKYFISITFIVVPIIVIIRAMIPFFQLIMSGKDIKEAVWPVVKSIIAGFIVFLIPSICKFVFTSLVDLSNSGLTQCFTYATLDNIKKLREIERENTNNTLDSNRKKLLEELERQREEEEKERERIKQQREKEERTSPGTGIWKNSLYPLPSGSSNCRSSVFGPRTNPVTGQYENHSGDDYEAACGTSVYAVLDGTVVEAANDGGYHGGMGNYVKIRHSDGLYSVYMHSSNVIVSPGEKVNKGQEIMKVGTTGMSTGCHLHISIRDASGTNLAPNKYIPTLSSCY